MKTTAVPARALWAAFLAVVLLLPLVHMHTEGLATGASIATAAAQESGSGVQAAPRAVSSQPSSPCLACLLAQQTTGRLTEKPWQPLTLPQAQPVSPSWSAPATGDNVSLTDPRGPPTR